LLSGAAAWPLAARAQQPQRMRRAGVLMAFAESDAKAQARVVVFREGLQKLGWAERRNIQIEYHWAPEEDATICEGTRRAAACKIWYLISRTVSEDDAHHGNNDDHSVGAFAVNARAFGAPLCGIGA
jgi:putative ABC transport system substrate-binding protein